MAITTATEIPRDLLINIHRKDYKTRILACLKREAIKKIIYLTRR